MVALPADERRGVRLGWMDALRGMAMTLVILDHAIAHTVDHAGTLPPWVAGTTASFDPLRMPLMAFLSGTLLSQSLSKGAARFIEGKVRNILYPYLLWTVIYTAIWILVSPLTGTPHHVSELFWNIFDPPGHLWFVYYLFFFYCLMLPLDRLPRMPLIVGLFLAAALCTWLDLLKLERFFFLFAFFVLGHHATRNAETTVLLLRQPAVIVAMAVLALGMPAAAALAETTVRYEPISIPIALAGVGLMLIAANRVGERPALALFRYIGRNSLPAYIVHWMIIAIIVLTATRLLDVRAPVPVFVLGAGGGFLATLLAVEIVNRMPLRFLFSWPKASGRRAAYDATPERPRP
jgi:uncharacterized membrane protein YcfT